MPHSRGLNLKTAACVVALLLATAPLVAPAQESAVVRAPAFSADELTRLPAQNWITNGGNIFNQRYSTLDQINRDNISNLRAVWRVSLNGSGSAPGYSAQAQALVHEGTIFVVTGDNDVFAVDVQTGEFHWVHESDVDFESAKICCGRLSRGVGLGDGKVFLGRLDGRLVALDQQTGEVVWDILAGDPTFGYGITSAPLYYDGMVITGFTGGEYGVRGRISAYDANTGEQIWNFYTIPGPGEIGHATWPQDNDAWMYGGAPVWQTPTIDPELGMIYFATGNAAPDMNGANRAGDNLFTATILALDVHTGAYRWHYQVVRHDIWDYDSANPTILFDAEFDGMPRKAIAHVNKNGFLFILNRASGVPLTPVLETPVPQDAVQQTAATQPIPQGDWLIRHDIDVIGERFDGTIRNRGRTFTPFNAEQEAIWRPLSAVNWPPSSYNVENNLMYICAADGLGRGMGGDPDAPIGFDGGEHEYYMQGSFSGARDVGADTRQMLVAMDVTTNTVVWRRLLDQRCFGSITTAGGLVFTGRINGELTAMDSDTGQRLWSFQTDGGFTTTATTFEYRGTQYLVGIAGGGITGGRINDGLWLFSLDGTMESLPPGSGDPLPAESAASEAESPTEVALAAVDPTHTPDLQRGSVLYRSVCQACHGETGEGGHMDGLPLRDDLTIAEIVATARAGVPGTAMVAFGAMYQPAELHDIAAYIVEELLLGR